MDNYTPTPDYYYDYICHAGVKGMKWKKGTKGAKGSTDKGGKSASAKSSTATSEKSSVTSDKKAGVGKTEKQWREEEFKVNPPTPVDYLERIRKNYKAKKGRNVHG